MRFVATAALPLAALTLSVGLTSVDAQTSTTTHHTTPTRTAAQRRAATNGTSQPEEGLAAVGTMPAATGPVKTLYALRYVDLKIGTGEPAQTRKFYTVHYTGWTTDGKKFDSSFDHEGGEPFVFPAGARPARVIIAWDTGFEGMRIGGKRRLIVPYELAYGEVGSPPVIPAKADLIFDVELLAQNDTPPQQPAPPSSNPAGTAPQRPAQQPAANPATDPANKTAAKPE